MVIEVHQYYQYVIWIDSSLQVESLPEIVGNTPLYIRLIVTDVFEISTYW